MTYLNITFTKDLLSELLTQIPDLDDLYQALPQQLWHLSGPHGRLLQDASFYQAKIKDNYGVEKLPHFPGHYMVRGERYHNEKELMTVWQKSQGWSLNDQLLLASMMASLALVKYLVSKGADVYDRYNFAAYLAAKHGQLEVVKYLVENGADIRAENDLAFRQAAHFGHSEMVKYLVEQGADIHALDNHALRFAAGSGHLSIVKYLLEKGADIHALSDAPIHQAAREDHSEVVIFLAENGANANVLTPEQRKQYGV